MKCYNCEHILPDDSEFCQYCGKKIEPKENNSLSSSEIVIEDVLIQETETQEKPIIHNPQLQKPEATKSIIKKSKETKKRFCRKCGHIIDDKSQKCTGCGKQYFRGIRLKPMLNCIFGVIILVSLFFNIMQYISYTDLESEKSNVVSEKQGLEKEVKKLKESVSAEYVKGYDAGYSLGYSKGKSQSTIVTQPNITYSYSYDEDESCAIPGCSRSPKRNSFYCSSHECMDVGCHNQRANDFCNYCVNHKCAIPNCNSSQAYNSVYCYRHK